MSAQIDVGRIVESYAAGEHEIAAHIRTGEVGMDPVSGEIVEECTPEQARELTVRIRQHGEIMWTLVKRAYRSRAWAVLGYGSWDEYCTEEFGKSRMKLPLEERQEVIGSLREAGLSTRAIAAATGYDRKTVTKDLAQVGESGPPESKDATQKGGGNDGTASEGDAGSDSEPTRATGPLDAAPSDGPHSHDVGRPVPEPTSTSTSPDPEPEPQPARVTGIDGKTYSASRPARREPSDAEVHDKAAEVLGEGDDAKAEQLRQTFRRLNSQAVGGLFALSPEHLAVVLERDQWQAVEDTYRQARDWFERLLAARRKPFTVIDGGH